MDTAVRFDLTLHAMMLFQSGIPMLYSGDEIGQLNDYSYKDDPAKAADSRYIHRGRLPWDRAAQRTDTKTPAGKIFQGLHQLETLRRGNAAFEASAEFHTLDTGDNAVLGLSRTGGGQTLVGLFNFGGEAKKVTLPAGSFTDMTTAPGKKKKALNGPVTLPPYSFFWLQKKA